MMGNSTDTSSSVVTSSLVLDLVHVRAKTVHLQLACSVKTALFLLESGRVLEETNVAEHVSGDAEGEVGSAVSRSALHQDDSSNCAWQVS